MGFSLRYFKYRPLTNMLPKTCGIFYESEFLDSKGRMTLKFMISAFVWKSKTRVTSYELQVQIHELRVQIHKLED